jgi:hypothetical protein
MTNHILAKILAVVAFVAVATPGQTENLIERLWPEVPKRHRIWPPVEFDHPWMAGPAQEQRNKHKLARRARLQANSAGLKGRLAVGSRRQQEVAEGRKRGKKIAIL